MGTHRRAASVLLVLMAAWTNCAAEVYRWRDADGVVHYSDQPPAREPARRVEIDPYVAPSGPAPVPLARPDAPDVRPRQQSQPRILMYTSPTCGYCRRAERYFTRRGLSWRSIDITASQRNYERFVRAGGHGTPLIFVDGRRVDGFDAATLDRLLPP